MKQFQYFQRSLDLERLRWTATFGWWVAGIRLFHSPDCRSQNLEAEFPVLLFLVALHVQIKELFSFLKSIQYSHDRSGTYLGSYILLTRRRMCLDTLPTVFSAVHVNILPVSSLLTACITKFSHDVLASSDFMRLAVEVKSLIVHSTFLFT